MNLEEPIRDDEPVPEWHIQIVEERMARYAREGTEWTPFEEFEKELLERLNNLSKQLDSPSKD